MLKIIFFLLTYELMLSALSINNTIINSKVHSYIVTPNETIIIKADRCLGLEHRQDHYLFKTDQNTIIQCDNRDMKIIVKSSKVTKEKILHYPVGSYPKPLKDLDTYKAPLYFLSVPNSKEDHPLSKHFNAKDFLCKQPSSYPKYLVVQTSLINLLEEMLDELYRRKIPVKNFVIMSGYRTPLYNRRIGSSKHSRHMYGDAADIYVDDNHDGFFDDLDGDGKTTDRDTEYLADLAEYVQKKLYIKGGIGIYKRTSNHPRFLHVDTRGYKARWGHF